MSTVYFVRHAQAEHNLAAEVYPFGSQERLIVYQSPEYFNPQLTQEGALQASTSLSEKFSSVDNVSTIYVSTLSRTLQTAHLGLSKFRESDTVWIASDFIREYSRGRHPCDHRGTAAEASNMFNYIDFRWVTEHDPIEMGEPEEAVDVRIGEFIKVLAKLKRRRERYFDGDVGNVIVVSHRSYLREFFRKVFKEETNLENCEVVTKTLSEVLKTAQENGFELE